MKARSVSQNEDEMNSNLIINPTEEVQHDIPKSIYSILIPIPAPTLLLPEPVVIEELKIIIPERNDSEEVGYEYPHDTACDFSNLLFPLILLPPLSSAATETANIAMDLIAMSPNPGLPHIIIGSIGAFFSSIGLNTPTLINNVNQVIHIIQQHELPPEWPSLSSAREKLAITLSFIPGTWAPISSGIQAYFFVIAAPGEYQFAPRVDSRFWSSFSAVIAIGTGITSIFTDSAEMYKTVRNRLAGVHFPYQNQFSKWASPTFGCFLSLLKISQTAAQSYVATKSIFGIESLTGKILIAVPSLLNCIPDFCFTNIFTVDALDRFFGYIPKQKVEPIKMIAFSCSVGLAVYLAFLKRSLNLTFIDIAPELIPQIASEVYSWMIFVQESLLVTASLYDTVHNTFSFASNTAYKGFSKFYGLFSSSSPREEMSDQPLLTDQPEMSSEFSL